MLSISPELLLPGLAQAEPTDSWMCASAVRVGRSAPLCSAARDGHWPGHDLAPRAGHGVITIAWNPLPPTWIGLPGVPVAVLIGVTLDPVLT